MFPEAHYDTPVLELYVPMPLHIKLGVANDCFRVMETFFPEQMTQFFEDFSFRKGGGPGNDFTGKTISEMIKEEKLVLLGQSLGEDGDIFIRYLAAIREMMAVCNQEQLTDYSYEEKAEEFRDAFEELQETYGLAETIKVHILGHHVPDYLARTGNFSCRVCQITSLLFKTPVLDIWRYFLGGFKEKRKLSDATCILCSKHLFFF